MDSTLQSLACDMEVLTHLAQLILDQITVAQATIDQAILESQDT